MELAPDLSRKSVALEQMAYNGGIFIAISR